MGILLPHVGMMQHELQSIPNITKIIAKIISKAIKKKRTNRNCPWDKEDQLVGQTGTRPWDKPSALCLIPREKRHFVPFVPGMGGGSSLG